MMYDTYMKKKGFTLIELLVAISVMAVVMAFALPNYLGARERARDAKRKAEFAQLKSALRLYYNDYGMYPANNIASAILGCGGPTPSPCPNQASSCTAFQFSAGGTGCSVIYMKTLPSSSYKYYQQGSGDGFLVCYDSMENASDPEILASQIKCGVVPAGSTTPSGTRYCVCSD